jgi:hypothetical protein
VLLSNTGPVVVNVPAPERYALHKLLVYGERTGSLVTKSKKDLKQSAHLLSWFKTQRPEAVLMAWDDLLSRGPGWVERARQAYTALNRDYPALELKDWLPSPETQKKRPARGLS